MTAFCECKDLYTGGPMPPLSLTCPKCHRAYKPIEVRPEVLEEVRRQMESVRPKPLFTIDSIAARMPGCEGLFKVAGAETGAVVEEALRSRRPPAPRVMTGDKPRNRGPMDEGDEGDASAGPGHDPTDTTVSPGTEVSAALGDIEDVVMAEPEIAGYRDRTLALFRARGLATAAALNELARRKLFPDSEHRDLRAVMWQALVDAGLLPSQKSSPPSGFMTWNGSPESLVIPSEPRPDRAEQNDLAPRSPLTAGQPRITIGSIKMGPDLVASDPDPVIASFDPALARKGGRWDPEPVEDYKARILEAQRIADRSPPLNTPPAEPVSEAPFESGEAYRARIRGYYPADPLTAKGAAPTSEQFALGSPPRFTADGDLIMPRATGLFANVDFKTGPVPDLCHPGEIVVSFGKPTDNHRSMMPVIVAFHSAEGLFVLDSGEVSALDLVKAGEVVIRAKLPERPAEMFHERAGLVALADPPDPAKLAAKATAAGISMDRIDSALWLALDEAEHQRKRARAAREAQAKAVRSRDNTGTKLGELWRKWGRSVAGELEDSDLRNAIGKLIRTGVAALTWLRDQAASIDADLPVAELDEAQLRGVVGVELLRLRRELSAALADAEAERGRIGKLVAERAEMRVELDAARMTNQALAYPGRDEEGRLLSAEPNRVIEPGNAGRWGLSDREYFLFRLGQHGAKGADVAGAGVHRLAYLLDVAEAERRDG